MTALDVTLWAVVLVGAVGLPLTVARSLGRRGPLFGALWLTWIIVSAVLAHTGVYAQRADAIVVSLPITVVLAFTVAYFLIGPLIGPADLVGLTRGHAFRVAGIGFLLAWAAGLLPAIFALPAGFGDIAVGLAAPAVAARLARGDGSRHETARSALWFHLFGMLDLVVALGLGIAAAVGPARILTVDPSTAYAVVLPLALIPTTAVPLLAAMHARALLRLRHAPATQPALA